MAITQYPLPEVVKRLEISCATVEGDILEVDFAFSGTFVPFRIDIAGCDDDSTVNVVNVSKADLVELYRHIGAYLKSKDLI